MHLQIKLQDWRCRHLYSRVKASGKYFTHVRKLFDFAVRNGDTLGAQELTTQLESITAHMRKLGDKHSAASARYTVLCEKAIAKGDKRVKVWQRRFLIGRFVENGTITLGVDL